MNEVIRILMERDHLTEEEAREQVIKCRDALWDGEYEAIQDYLGLEDDYIFDILDM